MEAKIKEIGLSDEQLTKVSEVLKTHVADLKQQWDKKANDDAEGIIQGAADKVEVLTGIKRDKGQKIADYLSVAAESYVKGSKAALETKELELETKLKNNKGDEVLKQQLQETKGKLDILLQKEAQFSEWEKEDYKGKYEQANQKLSEFKLNIAFQEVKPNFPDSVNEYEAKGRWNEFKTDILKKYNIEIGEDNEPIAIDKENQYKIFKLKELVLQNKEISELAKGREAKGLGSDPKTAISIEGVPFKVPENATAKERQASIKEYLTGTLKLSVTSSEYAKQFADLNKKILEKKPA
jgi:hypothetical protein